MSQTKKPLYQPWSEEEFQAAVCVRAMTNLQRWMYRSLLQAAFFHSTRPYLPTDDSTLWVLAGCKNLTQWTANKKEILDCFTFVEIDGRVLLEQKRLTTDWNRIIAAREKMAEMGRISAAVKRGFNGSSTHVEPTSNGSSTHVQQREVKGSEVKVRESNSNTVRKTDGEDTMGTPQTLKSKLIAICEENNIFPDQKLAPESASKLKTLERMGRTEDVVCSFRGWLSVHFHSKMPISDFVRQLKPFEVGPITEDRKVVGQEVLMSVIDKMVDISKGEVTFGLGHQDLIAKMLQSYQPQEVVNAFMEFWGNIEEKNISFAAKNFAESGDQIIRKHRRDAAEKKIVDAHLERFAENRRKQIEADLKAIAEGKAERDRQRKECDDLGVL